MFHRYLLNPTRISAFGESSKELCIELAHRKTGEYMNKWREGWMDGWMDRWTDRRISTIFKR